VNGHLIGYGEKVFASGDLYKGDFLNNNEHGRAD